MRRSASRVTTLKIRDLRFPTSRELDGSDAMNPDPDYSAAYVVVRTDARDGLEGHGFAFTIGRGNEVQVAGIRRGRALDSLRGRSYGSEQSISGGFPSARFVAARPGGSKARSGTT